MATPRPLRWTLQAVDRTGPAFTALWRRIGQTKSRFVSLGGAVRGGLVGAITGAIAGKTVGALADDAERLEDLSATFNSTATEVDGLTQAFIDAGVPAQRVDTLLQKLAGTAADAREGNAELAGAFEQFGVDPTQLNTVRQLIALIDGVTRAGPGARLDVLRKLVGEEGIGSVKRVGADVPNVAAFIREAANQGRLIRPETAKKYDDATSVFAGASVKFKRATQELLLNVLPGLKFLPNLYLHGRERAVGELQRESKDTDLGKALLPVLKDIRNNTRNSGVLGP